MQPSNQPPPAWAMTIPAQPKDGAAPPVAPITAQGGLTEPDCDGHQWVLLMIGDGTVSITLRIPWQTAAGFGQAIHAMMQQLGAQAAAMAGPQLIVPPPGTDLGSLGINPNGHKP